MDSLFTEPSMEKSPKTSTETDADLFKIPFSATKLRHSLSEGGKPPPKPRNGYHRMHSFHSTLSDGNWDEDDRPTSQSPSSESTFLPSEFRDTIFKDFPGLSKNGFHSHSFDGDIFEETADKFSSGFFSESEIDVIPRSSLFQRTGLRRSTSQVEPERHRRGFRQNCEEAAAQESAERDSRHAKIEELIRLKKKLEDLKASWQSNGDKGGQHEKKVSQEEEKEGKEEDLLESRLKTLKDKGKMKRRRLSSSKRSQSLSSKLMEELLEEDEGSTEIETFDDDDIKEEKEAASSAVKENCRGSLRDGARDKTDEKLKQNETLVDFECESSHMSPSSVRQSRPDDTSRWRERSDTSDQEISPASSPLSNPQRDTDYGLIFRGRHDEDDDGDITPRFSRRHRFDDTQGTFQKDVDGEDDDGDITPRFSRRDRFDDTRGTCHKDVECEEDDDIIPRYSKRDRFDDTQGIYQKDVDYKEGDKDVPFSYVRRRHQYDDSSKWSKRHQSDSARAMSLSDMSPTDKGRSQLNAALVQNKKRIDSEPEDEDWSPSDSRFDDSNRWSSRGTDYGQESDYPTKVERNRSDKAARGKNGRSDELKDREANLGRGSGCNDVRPRDSNYKRDGSSRENRRSKLDDAARWSGRGSDPEIDMNRHLPSSSPGRKNNVDTNFRQRGRDIIDHKPEGGYEPLSYSRRNKFGNVSKEIERGSEVEDGHISPSYETRMNEPLKSSESCINSDCKSWKDEHKESFFTEGEGISVKRKPQSRPVGGRKTSLDNENIGSSSGQKFRRSFSTSYDVNESRRRTNSSRFGSSRKSSDSDDEKVNPDICSNFRRRSQDLEDEAKNYNIQQDTFSIRSEDNSSHQAAKSFASASVDFKDKMDRPFLGTGMLGRSPERKSKQSVRPDRFGVNDIFKKFSIPSRDFFEDEFFASDWKRHRLIEEIGGIQRNLADITKRELGKRRNAQGDEKEETGQPSRRRGCEDVKIRRSPSVIDLQTERSNLTGLLKQLICKKQEREQQIRNRIDQLKHEKQTEEGEKQDTKCRLGEDGEEEKEEARCNKTDERIEIVQRDGEDEVSFVLRRAGADDFIPIVKKNEITIDRLYQLMPSDFIELGIADPEIQRRLQEEIDRHFVEQKNAQLKAASLERPTNDNKSKDEKEEDVEGNKELGIPCTPISSAPEGYEPEVPVHVSAECVICMDNQSNLLFLNCGHVCCCYDCAISLSLCPLCRSEIASKLIMNDSLPDASEL